MKNHMIIIGGMGPQASVQLHSLLISNKHTNFKSPDEFPLIVHISIPVPDFISSPDSVPIAVKMIENVGKSINTDDASVIGLACNTAHSLLAELPSLHKDSFVSMIDAVVGDIKDSKFKKVGLLASPFTTQNGLYHKALETWDIEVVKPSDKDIDHLGTIIRHVIAGERPDSLRSELTAIAKRLEKQGVDCILLGCTELPLVGISSELPVIDSLSSLAKAMLQRFVGVRL